MDIKIYNNISEQVKVGKTLINVRDISGELKEACDIINPVIIISGENLSSYNYLYIPIFNRYYFITDIKVIRNNLWEISCHCDVLETYKNEIKKQKAIVARQENAYNLYLNDPEWKIYTNKQVLTRSFPSGFNDTGNYYMTVIGGYDDVTEGSGV